MASLFTLQGANYVLPLVTLPYLVRVLGPEKFGLIAFAQAFIQYFVVATDYGFNLSATRDVAVHRDNPQKLGEIISAVMAIKILLALAGAAILGAFTWMVPTFHQHWPLYLVVYLTVAGATLFPTWLFQGLERMRDITWMNMATRLLTTAAIFIFVHNPQNYVLAAAIQSLPVLLAAVPAWLVLLRRGHSVPLQRPTIQAMREQIKGGWHVFLSTAAINVYTSSNTVALGLIAGPVAVGYFSAASKISGAVLGLYQPINQTLYPYVSTLFSKSKNNAIAFINKIYYGYISAGLIMTIIVQIFAKDIILIMAGADYLPAIPILKCLALLPIILTFGHIYGGLTMLPFGMTQLFSRIVVTSMVVDLLLIYPLVLQLGGLGAAITTVLSEMCVSGLMIFIAKKYQLLTKQQVST
jgi:PST family polysaccharide transporter